MMNKAFETIKKGLEEALQHASKKGDVIQIHAPKMVNVKALRKKTGMTQMQFAAMFGFGLGTLRHWERGDRKPSGPSLVLLNVIKKDPKIVLESLRA
jgi:putative transcriptional regulator